MGGFNKTITKMFSDISIDAKFCPSILQRSIESNQWKMELPKIEESSLSSFDVC